jgi:hypothetical protein
MPIPDCFTNHLTVLGCIEAIGIGAVLGLCILGIIWPGGGHPAEADDTVSSPSRPGQRFLNSPAI